MTCLRCQTRMFTSHVQEREDVNGYGCVLITEVFINECPKCTAWVKVGLPPLPTDTPEMLADH